MRRRSPATPGPAPRRPAFAEAKPLRLRAGRRVVVDLGGRPVALELGRSGRARHVSLRIDARTAACIVTLPPRAAVAEGLALARKEAAWILGRLGRLPPSVPFADGATLPVLGVGLRVRHCPDGRGGAWRQGDEIRVSGRPEHLARRLEDWLRREARRALAERAEAKAAALGLRPGRVGVRDTLSRWGSCSRDGALSFCWRLVLAPAAVLDYVVAHEVAHLRYRGHGPRFWRLVDRLAGDSAGARRWLRRHGDSLFRYG
jgi:predicted metal-dependent hydrolase